MKVIKFAPGLIPVLKHGEHDQASHGNWATGELSGEQKAVVSAWTSLSNKTSWRQIANDLSEGKTPNASESDIKTVQTLVNTIKQNGVIPSEALGFAASLTTGLRWQGTLPKVGDNLKNELSSATIDDRTAERFSQYSDFGGAKGKPVVFHYGYGTKGLDVNRTGADAFADEKEWLVSGTFEVTDKYSENGITHVNLKPITSVKKHGTHDQKTHGNWARGGGGNGLGHRAVYQLQVNMPDILKSSVYAAEANHNGHSKWFNPVEKPFPPNNRDEYATSAEYDKAYKEYSKKFDEWAKGEGKRLESDLGKELLDGTKAGVQRYVNKVTDSDWFTEAFGDGGIIGTPKVTLTSSNRVIGQYTVGVKNGVGISGLAIHKYNMQDEVTILHEIAHYATAINETNRYSAHSQEFARNHLYILDHAISPAYADGLEKAYREAGVPLGK